MYRVSPFVPRFAKALLGGAALATFWVNLAPSSYYDVIEFRLADLSLPSWLTPLPVSLTPMSVVADGLMALFFAFVAKELWEALVLQRGALRGRQALLPLGLTFGGMAGAAGLWILLSVLIETAEEATFATGWQVPLGSDVVLCYLFGRRIFGPAHPALHLLLLVTIATDILALLILGLTATAPVLRLYWLVLPLLAAGTVWLAIGRPRATDVPERQRRALRLLWPYGLAGLLSWLGVAASGLPPALGLLPVIPAIAHADRSFGMFAEVEEVLHDPLNRLAKALAWPVTLALFLFGLTRGGVDLTAFAATTWVALLSVWVGRPLGMTVLGLGFAAALGLRLPQGINLRDVLVIAVLMGLGFTLPILALDTALPGGAMQEAARLGFALSLLIGPAVWLILPRRGAAGRTSP